MANTYTLIASSTVGSGGASSIDFTSIPATYTDLVLKVSLRAANALAYNSAFLIFNGSTSGFSEILVYGNSTGAVSISNSGAQIDYLWADGANATASTFGNAEIYIPNYAGSTNKPVSFDITTENNAATTNAALASLMAGLWSNTAAINRVTITAGSSSTFVQYSTAYLYGVRSS